jgi:hypothetical protein
VTDASALSPPQWLRLRQIALVAEKLAPVEEEIAGVLGVEVCYRDPGVGHFGLENALFPIGNQLLEVVAPTREGTAGGRYLDRRGGDGGYMVITQCNAHAPRRARVKELGVRVVNHYDSGEFRNMQLHPKDTGGSFFEIDEMVGPGAHDLDGPWEPAGKDWQRARCTERVTAILAAEVQCADPGKVAERWSEIAELPLADKDGALTLALDNAAVRFVPCTDGRPEGLGGIDVACADKAAVLASAKPRGAVTGTDQVTLCGLRINLV